MSVACVFACGLHVCQCVCVCVRLHVCVFECSCVRCESCMQYDYRSSSVFLLLKSIPKDGVLTSLGWLQPRSHVTRTGTSLSQLCTPVYTWKAKTWSCRIQIHNRYRKPGFLFTTMVHQAIRSSFAKVLLFFWQVLMSVICDVDLIVSLCIFNCIYRLWSMQSPFCCDSVQQVISDRLCQHATTMTKLDWLTLTDPSPQRWWTHNFSVASEERTFECVCPLSVRDSMAGRLFCGREVHSTNFLQRLYNYESPNCFLFSYCIEGSFVLTLFIFKAPNYVLARTLTERVV